MGETDYRRIFGWAIVAGLCLAAAVAVLALLTGEIDDTDVRIVVTSLAFSVCTAVGAPGVNLLRREGALRLLGGLSSAAAAISYVLLLVPLWLEDAGDELWEAWGTASVIALGLSHASLVLAGRRTSDTSAIRSFVGASVVLGAVDTAIGALTINGVFEDIDEAWVRLFGVTVVLLVLTTVLPPVMRRLGRSDGTPDPAVADEIEAIADRIDAIDDQPRIRAETAALRRLAGRARRR